VSDRPGVIAGVLIILFLVGIVYAIMEDPFGVFRKPPKPKVPPLKRDPTQPMQVLERHGRAGVEPEGIPGPVRAGEYRRLRVQRAGRFRE